MNVWNTLLGLRTYDDLTDTAWWNETVFRELEREAAGAAFEEGADLGAAGLEGDLV